MTVIESSSSSARTMADGTLRLTVDIEPRHSQAAFALFGAPGTPMALAALKSATSEPAAPKPAGGERAKWCAMRCQDPAFHRWLQDAFPQQWCQAPGETPAMWAASAIRAVCSIESRKELDNDAAAAERFDRLIRRPFGAANV